MVDGVRSLDLKHNDSSNLKYSLKDEPKIRKYLLDYFFSFLLLPYSSSQNIKTVPGIQNAASSAVENPPVPVDETPSCMSEAIYKRLKANTNLENGDEIEQVGLKLELYKIKRV